MVDASGGGVLGESGGKGNVVLCAPLKEEMDSHKSLVDCSLMEMA